MFKTYLFVKQNIVIKQNILISLDKNLTEKEYI